MTGVEAGAAAEFGASLGPGTLIGMRLRAIGHVRVSLD